MEPIIFATDAKSAALKYPGLIIVSPSRDPWNDFGFRIRVDIHINGPATFGEGLRLPAYLGFLATDEKKSDVRYLETILADMPNGCLASDRTPAFFTMLPDMQAYRDIVSRLGSEKAVKALVALHDVVAADQGVRGSALLGGAPDTTVFKQAFLRSSESFFAWTNAGPILLGLQHEEVGRISSTLSIAFRLDGRPNDHELSFRFAVSDQVLPRRFAVVIGKNGVGKSQALRHIAQAALSGSGALTDGMGNRPSLNRLLAFVPTSIGSSTFPSERRRSPRIRYRRFALSSAGGARGRKTTSELIVQLARSDERVYDRDRLKIFLSAIAAIDSWHELGLRTDRGCDGIIKLAELRGRNEEDTLRRYGSIDRRREPVRVINGKPYPLSSGEQSFVRFAAIASLHIENGTLVLLDEPETHLHPNFISQFVAVLDRLLEQTGSAAIIATHSVYFVREALEDQVIVLRSADDRSILAETPTLKTFGADVGLISYFVFGENQPSRLAQDVERRIADESASWQEAFEHYKDEISSDLLGEIRACMEPPRPARSR